MSLTKLYKKQWDFVLDESKFVLASGGVGAGKSYMAIVKLIHYCINNPGCVFLVGTYTYRQLKYVLLSQFFELINPVYIAKYSKQDNDVLLTNGSQIIFTSFQVENRYKGLTLGGAYIDELTSVREEVHQRIQVNLRQQNMPLRYWATTNSDKFSHWVYKTYYVNRDSVLNSVYDFISFENIFLPDEYLESLLALKDTNNAYFNQMVLGRWGVVTGCIIKEFKTYTGIMQGKYIAYLDTAFGGGDSTALSIGCKTDDLYYVIGYVWDDSVVELYDVIIDRLKRHGVGSLYIESNACKGLTCKEFIRRGWQSVHGVYEKTNKHNRIVSFLLGNHDKIRLHKQTDIDYISQLYGYSELGDGHDDSPDSMAGLIRALSTGGSRLTIKTEYA